MTESLQRFLPASLRCILQAGKQGIVACFDPIRTNFYSDRPSGNVRGRVLVAHLVEGLLLRPDDPLIRTHNHFVEARLMAEVLLEQGYAVDFIDYRNRGFVPNYQYDLFICPRVNFERLAQKMPAKCIRIVHLETAHWLRNNTAAHLRLQEVHQKRGVALQSYAEVRMNRAIETADYATVLGNGTTYEGYAFAGKPIFQLPNPAMGVEAGIDFKDFGLCRSRFLWLGSRGLVHKGLDLALEAFARMPELHLTVCGPIDQDPHFVQAFRKELYETPNIHAHGWIDIDGPDFAALIKRTLAHVYPSCAEGASGAVINCMRSGLLPIATPQCGVDIAPSFGVLLPEASVEAVMNAARQVAALAPEELAAMAKRSQLEARQAYSAERYKQVFGVVLARILEDAAQGRKMAPGFIRMDDVTPLVRP